MHVDFNLLPALDALVEEGSVAGAAARLHVTPPAMSRTLKRLRRATGDEILVRTGRGMVPTSRALALRGEVHDLVDRGQRILTPATHLDPAALTRTFTIEGHDALLSALAPPLLARLAEHAPHVQVRLLAEPPTDHLGLEHGEVDLQIGTGPQRTTGLSVREAATDELVVAGRRGHSLLRGPLTVGRYAAADHVVVSRRGRLRDPLDDALAEQGLTRRVVASIPTSAAALNLVATSDLAVSVARATCAGLVSALGLDVAALPMTARPIPMRVAWHRRFEQDAAHRWFRDLVIELTNSAGRT